MKCDVKKMGEWVVIEIIGNLKTNDDYEVFKETVNTVLDNNETNIILNLEHISFLNSSALGKFILISKKTDEKGGALKVINLSEDIEELFHTTRLSERIKIYESVAEAMKA